jgi:hypothetical protein
VPACNVWNGNEVRPREEDTEEMERTAVKKIFSKQNINVANCGEEDIF